MQNIADAIIIARFKKDECLEEGSNPVPGRHLEYLVRVLMLYQLQKSSSI